MASATTAVTTECARVLVPAFAQPDYPHEEQVGCIARTAQGRLVRLYPWRFRNQRPEQRFACGDLIEYETEASGDDTRPETCYVDTRTVRVLRSTDHLTPQQRVQLWGQQPGVPMADLQQARLTQGTSLGLVQPDEGSLRLHLRPMDESPRNQRLREAYRQLGRAMHPALARYPVEVELFYGFTSQGHAHELPLLDWYAHATCLRYMRRHTGPGEALRHLRHKYEQLMPSISLSLVVSTLHARAHAFSVIGLLSNGTSLDQATRPAPTRRMPHPLAQRSAIH